MFSTYRTVFRLPGTAAFCAAGFVMRTSIAIYPLGLVLLVSLETGEYSFAGLLSGVYILGGAVGSPLLARLVDRYGQRRLLLPATAVHVGAFALLCALAAADTPDWTLLAPAFVGGFAYLSVISLVRARWSYVLAGRPELTTAYSLESTLDEVIFVTGPLVATVIATHVDPIATMVVAALLVLAGAAWLSTLAASEPPAHATGADRLPSALREPGMGLLVAACIAMGALFATAEVSMIAFCGQRDAEAKSGLILAALALGSAVSGLAYGAKTRSADVLTRFRRQALIFAVLPVVFVAAVNLPLLAVCAFVVGLGIAPALITAFGVAERMVASGSLTEGLAWLGTGFNIGFGIGAPVAGAFADAHGARTGFVLTVLASSVVGVLAVTLHARQYDGAAKL